MCDLEYDLLWWSEAPLVDYSNDNGTEKLEGVVVEQFFSAFQSCCNGKLPIFRGHEYPNQAQMMRQVSNLSIAMPVSYESKVIGHDMGVFIRVIQSSGLAFVTQVPKSPEGNLLTQGAETVWPLLVLILVTCGYAGLIFWLAEFTVKREDRQIARSFFRGIFDGYWCAFITATTVGYGDKVTGSRFGKLLTIIWLLFGLGLMASFTAAMTQLMSSSYMDMSLPVTMKGCGKLGVLEGSLAQQMVIELGLKPLAAESFEDLHDLLENETINGFTLSQYYCSYNLNQIGESFKVTMGQVEPITTGIVYNAFCPACDELKSCMKRYLFVRSLDYSRTLEEKLNHRHEEKTSAMGLATQALGSDHSYLGIMSGVLTVLLLAAWLTDYLITRYLKKTKQNAPRCNQKEDSLKTENGAGEVLIA